MRPSRALLVASALFATSATAERRGLLESGTAAVVPPLGGETPGVEWRSVQAPGVGTFLMAVSRPSGQGPFGAVVILHGTHGFAREYVQLAKDLARGGVVAVAACWFAPGRGQGTRFVSAVPCSAGTPRLPPHQSTQAIRAIDSVIGAVRKLPDVKPDQVALFGHSRGGGEAWNYVLRRGNVRAIILNSAGYPDDLIQHAGMFGAPVLILHGEKDSAEDGGSAMTDVRRARAFQSALRNAGKPVHAVYYPHGGHNGLFASPAQREDELNQMKNFLRQYLQERR